MVSYLSKFNAVLVDGDTQQASTARFGVRGYPTVVFADREGNEVKRVVGAVPPAQFLNEARAAGEALGL